MYSSTSTTENTLINGIKSDWSEIEVETSWGTLRGKKFGQGKRKILGVHGWLDNANTFDCIVPLLDSNFTLISLDLPGHGKSDHFHSGFIYDPRGYAGAIKKAVEALSWEKFTYLGHSMGAVVGILYCAIFPEDVDSFISIDIIKPWSLEPEKYPLKMRQYFDSYFDNENKCSLPPLVYSWSELVSKTIAGSSGSLDETSAALLLQRGAVAAVEGQDEGFLLTRDLKAKTYFIGFMQFEVWIAMAEAITCPLLIIKAKNGHLYEPPERTVAMRAAYERNCRLYRYHELEGRHHLHLTHPLEVAEILQQFLSDSSTGVGDLATGTDLASAGFGMTGVAVNGASEGSKVEKNGTAMTKAKPDFRAEAMSWKAAEGAAEESEAVPGGAAESKQRQSAGQQQKFGNDGDLGQQNDNTNEGDVVFLDLEDVRS